MHMLMSIKKMRAILCPYFALTPSPPISHYHGTYIFEALLQGRYLFLFVVPTNARGHTPLGGCWLGHVPVSRNMLRF